MAELGWLGQVDAWQSRAKDATEDTSPDALFRFITTLDQFVLHGVMAHQPWAQG